MTHPADGSAHISNRSVLATFTVVFIAALAMRLLPWDRVFANGQVYYFDPDCYMRLRKILVYLMSFPQTAVHDYFQGYPKGTGVITAPTMEYLLAAILLPFRATDGLISFLERAIAVIPPVVGALTAALLYRFTSGIAGVSAGLTAGLVLAITPAHIEATVLGRFDNEMMEPLLLLLAFIGYIKTYYGGDRLRPWMAAGGLAFLYLSIWRGGIVLLSLVGIDLLVRLWSCRRDAQQLRTVGNGATSMYAVTAALLALVCLTNLWGSRLFFSFNVISWFHVLLFAGAAVLFFVMSRGFMKNTNTGLAYAVAAGISLLFVLGGEIISGLALLRGGNPWVESILQYKRQTDPLTYFRNFGLAIVLLPCGIYLLTREPLRTLREWRFLIIWGSAVLAATIFRQRYAEYLALSSALAAGICASWIVPRIPLSRISATAIVIIFVFALQFPSVAAIRAIKEQSVTDVFRGDVEETMNWLREHTPSAGDPFRPDRKPAYGVLARWDYGGWIEAIAQRPTVATNYGTETHGMEEAARFFLSTDEGEMAAILERNGIRYLVVDNVVTDLPMYAALIGEKSEAIGQLRDPVTGVMNYVPRPALSRLIISRLFLVNGTTAAFGMLRFAPVEGIRLVFESSSPALVSGLPWYVAKLKVFEVTPGARLQVEATPGSEVKLTQNVETNRGHRFEFLNSKIADEDGHASFSIVYPPKREEATGAVGPVVLEVDGRQRSIEVTAVDIETQRQIRVPRQRTRSPN
jgi:dolichyl-diphosphooligosaccharide--protein glycosyltransferase